METRQDGSSSHHLEPRQLQFTRSRPTPSAIISEGPDARGVTGFLQTASGMTPSEAKVFAR